MPFAFALPAVFQPGYYTACYLLAVGTYQLLLWHEGRRLGFALRPWLLMQAATLLAFVVGCKLVVLPVAEWPTLWQGGAGLATSPMRSALGGIAASSLVLLGLRRWLGLGWAAFDAFVLPLGLGLAVQCLGCLSAGCCWGELAGHGPGLSFGPGTWPYTTQVAQGLLPAGAAHSLPVVPTQLYGLLICLLIAGTSWATRHRAWPAGSRYLLGVGAVLLAWGGLCQWRDPASQTLGATPLVLGGVRLLVIQWVVLGAGLLHLGAAGWLLRRGAAAPAPALVASAPRPARQLIGVAVLLALTAALAPHALTGAEFRVLQVALGAVLLAELAAAWPLWAGVPTPARPRMALAALALLVLMSQAPAPTAAPDSARSIDFAVGASQGSYDQDFYFPATTQSGSSGGCGGSSSYPVPPSRVGYLHRYQTAGGQVALQLKPQGRGLIGTAGLGLWGGTERLETAPQPLTGPFQTQVTADPSTYYLFDFNPYLEGWHGRKGQLAMGYHLGFHLGTLLNNRAHRTKPLLTASTFLPDAQVWIGNRQSLFVQADVGYNAAGLGQYLGRLGLGSGLGSHKGNGLVVGVAANQMGLLDNANEDETPRSTLGFAAANLGLGNSGFSLEPTAATDFGRTAQFSLKLHYRVGLK